MDPISLILGALLLLLGIVLGRTTLASRPKAVEPSRPLCGCSHDMAMHDPKTGECHGKVEEPTAYNGIGKPTHYKTVRCTCQQYVGPRPIDTVFAPPMLPPTQSA